MNLKPIKTETDYQEALKEIEALFEVEANTSEWEKLDINSQCQTNIIPKNQV